MIYYIFLPLIVLILLIFQTTILNLVFLGKMGLEISLILVIYAGFRLDIMKGGFLAFISGFILDCLTGSVTGLFTFYYVVVFLVSRAVSFRVYSEGYFFIAAFTFVCAFAEAILITLIYHVFYEADIFLNIYKIFLAQALVVGLLSPVFFNWLGSLEGIIDVRESR